MPFPPIVWTARYPEKLFQSPGLLKTGRPTTRAGFVRWCVNIFNMYVCVCVHVSQMCICVSVCVCVQDVCVHQYQTVAACHTHTHTHTHIEASCMYVCMYACVCVCVCLCVWAGSDGGGDSGKTSFTWPSHTHTHTRGLSVCCAVRSEPRCDQCGINGKQEMKNKKKKINLLFENKVQSTF